MDSWRKSDGTLFFSGMQSIEQSDVVIVVGDDIYFAIKDLYEQLPFATIVGYTFNNDICTNIAKLAENWPNVMITDNIDDISYSLYEYSNYNDSTNTLVFPGTLSQIRTDSSINQFNEIINKFLNLNFTNIVLYDSFCYKSLCQTTPLDLYFSIMNNPKYDKEMIRIYELFYGSLMYYVNFVRFFIKYMLFEKYGGAYEWYDILEDCEELSINWNDFVRTVVTNGYRVQYVKMFADSDIKDFVEKETGHTIKVATQTRAVFTKKDSIYAK